MTANISSEQWNAWCARAWKDDWAALCDELGVKYDDMLQGDGDINSRELRKRVRVWADTAEHVADLNAALEARS